jgi:uroporphyrinogen-III synthase
MSDFDLKGRGILVTRAAHQADGLVTRIEACRGVAIRFPALEIVSCECPAQVRGQLLKAWDIIIFVSPNAVDHALKLLPTHSLEANLGAVGQATAAALRQSGYSIHLIPEGRYDSEGLLMLPQLRHMAGKKILIVRGEGGRAHLGESLRERGAEVGYAEVYRRTKPKADPDPLLAQWSQRVDLVTATSVEALENLVAMLGVAGWPLLRETPLLVISQRMRGEAEKMGFETTILAEGAADDAIILAILNWYKSIDR